MLVLPHLDAAHNLARWLLCSSADAEDATQEAMLRSFHFFHAFHGGDARAWLLQIVRNMCYTWLEKNRRMRDMAEFDEELHAPSGPTPEALAMGGGNRERLTRALESLPPRYSGGNRAPRVGRVFLQGDCRNHFDSTRDGYVHAFTCPSATSTGD
jgi:RNA polymerase sigma-70 factor (ECF subfamily)